MQKTNIKYKWQEKALCKKKLKIDQKTKKLVYFTINDFYPGVSKTSSEEVKQLCKKCPVINECLQHALFHENFGYWGGTSEKQRIAIRKQKKIIVHSPQSNHWIDSSNNIEERK